MSVEVRDYDSSGRAGADFLACPACCRPVEPGARTCSECHFSADVALAIFPGPPPPLLPVLDAADLLTEKGRTDAERAIAGMRLRFPQIHWRICTVHLPRSTRLPLFGFWLLNACALEDGESADDRAWTILLLLDAGSGRAAVIPGYAAERYLSDRGWESLLAKMKVRWELGDAAGAVTAFFQAARRELDRVWKRHGSHRQPPTPP